MPAERALTQLQELASGVHQVGEFARLDLYRAERTGVPEVGLPSCVAPPLMLGNIPNPRTEQVIWGPGKTAEQIAAILTRLAAKGERVLATRQELGMAPG